MNIDDLKKPFDPAKISWRVGPTNADKSSGIALAYIDARDVQDRLDEVCGIGGWQCRYTPMHDKKTVCEIGIFVECRQEWVWKADGAGDTDMEAEKGALSDAFKRAAVRWGIGRYLYDVENTWVKIEPSGKSYKIAQGEYARLRTTLGGGSAPAPANTDDPVSRARDWVAKAEPVIKALATKADMARWSRANAGALDRIRQADKALYDAINLKIALRNDELEASAA